jgi:LPXTG-motif cell wall-anchored protein
MIPGSLSLANQESTAFGDTSRSGQGSGQFGLINLVTGKGNTLRADQSAAASGAPEIPQWAWIAGGAAIVGAAVWLLLRRRKH